MKTANDQKRQQARSLFFQTGKTQAEIAAEVGVCDKTPTGSSLLYLNPTIKRKTPSGSTYATAQSKQSTF